MGPLSSACKYLRLNNVVEGYDVPAASGTPGAVDTVNVDLRIFNTSFYLPAKSQVTGFATGDNIVQINLRPLQDETASSTDYFFDLAGFETVMANLIPDLGAMAAQKR